MHLHHHCAKLSAHDYDDYDDLPIFFFFFRRGGKWGRRLELDVCVNSHHHTWPWQRSKIKKIGI